MVTTEEPQSQELMAPGGPARPPAAQPPSPGPGALGSPEPRGPVNAITVLTLLDKLVNMLDTVQGNQQRMEVGDPTRTPPPNPARTHHLTPP